MNFSNPTLSVLAILNLALVLYLVLRLLGLRARGARLGRSRGAGGERRQDVMAESQGRAIQRLEGQLGEIAKDSVRHVGVVRFDAFEDMGGRLSFSAALLDGHGDGVVITSINGRQDTRCYAKRIQNGTSIHNLSDEERQAIREALEGSRQIVEAS